MLEQSRKLRHWNTSMENPLKNDEYPRPQYKISNPKEWISLQFKATLNHCPYTHWSTKIEAYWSIQTYQTIQNGFAKKTNSIHRVHGNNELRPNGEYITTSIKQNKMQLPQSKISIVNDSILARKRGGAENQILTKLSPPLRDRRYG